MQIFGTITKTEDASDGTVYVEGVASTEDRDTQNEIVTAKAMAAALPAYLRFPTLREMHQAWAAGRTLAAAVDGKGRTVIRAKVVDKEACAKIREGVYNGFSIGGSVKRRNASDRSIIEELTLTEISLVDRPANPAAVIELFKADATDVQIDAPSAPATVIGPAHTCPTCGGALTCGTCDTGAAEKVAKLAGSLAADSIAKAHAERDTAVAKLAAVQGERDSLAKRLHDAQAELARRPKGALKAMPVSKAEDSGEVAPEPGPEPDAFSLVKAAHRRPLPPAGDGGPYQR